MTQEGDSRNAERRLQCLLPQALSASISRLGRFTEGVLSKSQFSRR